MRESYEQPQEQKPNQGARWIILIVAAIIVLFVFQKMGCGPLRTEDKVEWIDR